MTDIQRGSKLLDSTVHVNYVRHICANVCVSWQMYASV